MSKKSKFIEAKELNYLTVGFADERINDVDVDFDEFVGVTDDAALFMIADEEIWFPRSTIVNVFENQMIIREWIAIEKGLV